MRGEHISMPRVTTPSEVSPRGRKLIPDKLRVAFLGCGTITRTQHLPAALAHPAIEVTSLVDSDPKRAQALAQSSGIECSFFLDYREAMKGADAVVNALPNSLHAATTLELLRAGKHVLCEKPLATTSADARACAELAAEKGLVLAVGMNRRFEASHRLLHGVLRDEQIGKIGSYDWQYGGAFEWKSASAFYFSRDLAGGGVLMDFGVHLLDSLVSWFGPVTAVEYQDDDWGGGIEANCILDLQHDGEYGPVHGRVQMSRTIELRNRLLITGARAQAEIRVGDADTLLVHRNVGGLPVIDSLSIAGELGKSSFYKQLDNFVESIIGKQKPEVDGEQALRTVELIEQCYAHRRRIPEPWSEVNLTGNIARA
jgi:predicted dehydrogenase